MLRCEFYPFMLVAIDHAYQESGCGAAEGPSCEHHRGGHKEGFPSSGGVPANVYSDNGSEFKREFKELMDFWDIEEAGDQEVGEAMLRCIAAGAGRRGQWHLMLADILSQIKGGSTLPRRWRRTSPTDPEMAEIALRNIERRAKPR